MKPPKNRRVFVIGYGAATPLGNTFEKTWNNAVKGGSGFRRLTRCQTESLSNVVGEIPDWDPLSFDFVNKKEHYNWNAGFIFLAMAVCQEAIRNANIEIDKHIGPRTACLIGSAINGTDAFRIAMNNYLNQGPSKVSPYLLPNLCGNLPSGKAGMMMGFTGPIFSPQGACASGNHAIGIGARMIRDGDCDVALAGGVEYSLIPEIIQGFANMNATIKVTSEDRAYHDPKQASRPFSADRKGFVLSEGGAVIVLAAEEVLKAYGLMPRAEVMGIGWTSDANHFTRPNSETILRAIHEAIEDAEIAPSDIRHINAHGTSTKQGDKIEIETLRKVFDKELKKIPITSNKSQLGHSLGATAAIEAALAIEGMRHGIILPTINYIPDPEFSDIDIVAEECKVSLQKNQPRKQAHDLVLSNAFGFGGTNCCVIFRGV